MKKRPKTRERMTKSLDELQTMVMLLGPEWWYDMIDHTFNGSQQILDADTMEPINYTVDNSYMDRAKRVEGGEIGHQDTQLEQTNGRRTYP